MTNYERYKNEIEKFAKLNVRFALDKKTRNIICCAGVQCPQCEFYGDKKIGHICDDTKLKWADAEYVEEIEPEVDWSRVPVDTPILVSNDNVHWHRRYFAKYKDEVVYAWNDGFTSFASENNNRATLWKYAKLAEIE